MGKASDGAATKSLPKQVKTQAAAPVVVIYWQYRWCESTSGEIFGPFDGSTMSGWQQANLFTSNPAEARRCSADGQTLEGADWQPADQAEFMPQGEGLGRV